MLENCVKFEALCKIAPPKLKAIFSEGLLIPSTIRLRPSSTKHPKILQLLIVKYDMHSKSVTNNPNMHCTKTYAPPGD